MKRKEDYEAPVTSWTQVEMEGTFCGSIIKNEEKNNVTITEQEVGAESDYFSSGADWDY